MTLNEYTRNIHVFHYLYSYSDREHKVELGQKIKIHRHSIVNVGVFFHSNSRTNHIFDLSTVYSLPSISR